MNCIKGQKDMTLKDESPRSEGVQYATGEERRRTVNSPRKKEVSRPKCKRCSAVDVSGDESKIQSAKNSISQELETLGIRIKVNRTWTGKRW